MSSHFKTYSQRHNARLIKQKVLNTVKLINLESTLTTYNSNVQNIFESEARVSYDNIDNVEVNNEIQDDNAIVVNDEGDCFSRSSDQDDTNFVNFFDHS